MDRRSSTSKSLSDKTWVGGTRQHARRTCESGNYPAGVLATLTAFAASTVCTIDLHRVAAVHEYPFTQHGRRGNMASPGGTVLPLDVDPDLQPVTRGSTQWPAPSTKRRRRDDNSPSTLPSPSPRATARPSSWVSRVIEYGSLRARLHHGAGAARKRPSPVSAPSPYTITSRPAENCIIEQTQLRVTY